MSDQEAVEQARKAVGQILQALKVSRVVCVDDYYEDEPSVEQVVAVACSLKEGTLLDILPELGETIPSDQDVLIQKLRALWRELEPSTRKERAERILATGRLQAEVEKEDDPGDASILNELIPDNILLPLSPKQWEEQRKDLLKGDGELRTLFLFDHDFSANGGDAQGGIKIIASLLASNDTGNLICGLLTHTVTPQNQLEKWAALSQEYSIDRDRFLVIPKQYLSEKPMFFAQILKLVALSPDFTSMKSKVQKIIGDATNTAMKRVRDINIYDLDHIVFRISAEEGLWEPDMLFRLHGLFHRLEARRLAHADDELENIASRLRSVSNIPTPAAEFCPASSTREIQRQELYEDADHLNKNYLPLELGDIFMKTNSESRKRFILLAQPCDLMVRSNGTRQPELKHLTLAEIGTADDTPRYSEELKYFGKETSERWFVKLKQVHQVRSCIVDLCVLNDDGRAVMQLGGAAPERIRPTWKARYNILERVFRRLTRRPDILSNAEGDSGAIAKLKDQATASIISGLLHDQLVKGEVINTNGNLRIDFNLQRIGRLSRARAFGLLMAYTSCLSRPAYERDFAR